MLVSVIVVFMNIRGRVIEVQRIHTSVRLGDDSVVLATVRGEFHETGEYPKVGDWAEVTMVENSEETQAVIEKILPRTSVIERLDQETRQSQVLVTNVDIVFIVMGLDGDFNVKRLERYLLLARQGGIESVIILNKSDLAKNIEEQVTQVREVAQAVPVHTASAKTGYGLEDIKKYFSAETTAVLLGSSGAGKSTITNWLLGREAQETSGVREGDSRGRHTTTTRQLFELPDGGFLIDTPGMRELGVVDNGKDEDEDLIAQISRLADDCKFRNCDHDKSAGCAVIAAVEAGELSQVTLDNYYKLQRERYFLADQSDKKAIFKDQAKIRKEQARSVEERRRLGGGR